MDDYGFALKTIKAMAHDVGYTATSLKKVIGYAQDGDVDSRALLGALTVKCRELREYADELQTQCDVIEQCIDG